MMIPPIVRFGPLPENTPDTYGKQYVVLTHDEWDIVSWYDWRDHNGNPMLERHRTDGSLLYPAHVFCWMPQDGS